LSAINRDTAVAIFLLLLCGVLYAASYEIEQTSYATIGADVWPRLIIALLFVLSLVYLFQSIGKGPGKKVEHKAGFLSRYRNAIMLYGLFLGFLFTLDILGMLLGGIAFVFLALTVIGEPTPRNVAIHAGVAVVSVGAMWAIFTFGLRVILPEGVVLSFW
jgi:hypothetical protein